MRIYHNSNATMLAKSGVARFEITLCKGNTYFGPKSRITLLYRINVTISNMNVIWFNENITRLQRHHARPKWTCLFREHSMQRLHICGPKSWITLLYRINVTISNMSVIWFNEDIPQLQRHHARQKWSCLFREHSLQRFHNFGPNPWFTILHRINVTISDMSVIWFNENITRLQRHHATPKWSCLFREHSPPRFHKFRTKIMNHAFVQDKCDNSKYECYLV